MSSVYAEERVNTYTPDYQYAPSVSPLAGGGYVVVWTSREQDGSGDGIYAQRFTASGLPNGPEFRINTTTSNAQLEPSVTGLSDGSFAVVWTDRGGADGSSYGIYQQRVSATGQLLGDEQKVNTYTSYDQAQPAIAAYDGGYVVSWYSNVQDGSGYGVYAQRFDNAGTPVATGGSNEFRVNTVTSDNQYEPDVAAFADGRFVVVWRSDGQDGSGAGVYAQRYNADGSLAGGEFRVNSATTSSQYEARVAALDGGGFVVVWRSDNQDGSSTGVYGQRYNADGSPAGGEFRVNESTTGGQYQPAVSALAGGGFAVSWYNDNYDASGNGSYQDVYVREYAGDGSALTGQLKANTPTANQSQQHEPAIASLGNGNYVVVWRSEGQDGSLSGIYQQLFGDATELPRQLNPELGDFAGTLTFGENLVNATPQIIDPAVSLLDLDSTNLDGGRVEIFYTQFGSPEDQLGVRNQGTGVAQIGVSGSTVSYNDGSGPVAIGTLSGGSNGSPLTVTFNANASVDAVEALIQNLTYANSSNSPQASRTVALRVYDGDGGVSNAGSVQINVTREIDGTALAHGEEQVNTHTPGTQEWPSAATLADGSYVVVWQSSSGQDGDSWGLYAQRFANNGEAIGPEVRVNTLTGGEQSWAQVAALSTGGYVVSWQDSVNDGSSYGTYGQRFDAAGSPLGGQFLINTTTSGTQYHNNVAAYPDGFAAVWSTGSDIYLQRFTNDGAKVGAETLVSTVPGGATAQGGAQYLPDVAAWSNGNLVVVWDDDGGNDGDDNGIFGRIYDAGTGSFGSTFLVNTTTSSFQSYDSNESYAPNVAVLASGDFVVVWAAYDQDGSGWAVVGQRFDASGNKLSGEFIVNETLSGSQYQPEITALSTGGFVVSFYNDNYDISGGGTQNDVYIREYDASANPIDGQRKLESPDNNTAYEPAVTDLGGGNFAVIYSGYATSANGGNNTYEIRQQLFGDATTLARSASPELGDFATTVTFAENDVNAGLQALDTAVGLTDPDSGNFSGGRLDLYYVQGASAEDQLGVIHEGDGPGQIGLSGTTISYGGSAIGTVSGGVSGGNLRIDFTSSAATVEAVEALIQHLGYRNADSSPNTTRSLALRVSDGDGGTSEPSTFTLNITQNLDGTALVHGEGQVNSHTTSNQHWPSAATLADGSYVVTWQSNGGQDGDSWGLYAQRFANNGEAIGPEVRVNTLVGGAQSWAQAAALSTGGYVITWQDDGANDGSGYGTYGQRFDAAGSPLGGQFLINTTTSGTQYHNNVAAYSGGFAAVWSTGSDIYLQRFTNDGAKVGAETLVSTVPGGATAQGGSQYQPDVAAWGNGNLVVVWADAGGNDGDSYGVYGRLYDAGTGSFGSTFLVTTTTASQQAYASDYDFSPNVAVLANGDFVAVWPSNGQDGSGWAVVGQRFDASGNKLGGEFIVNETLSGSQYQPEITALSTGGFVVSFYNDNYDISGGGTQNDVYIREYDASANPIDGQRKLESPDNNTAYEPAVTDLGGGNFAVIYSGYATSANGGNNTYEIRQQLFGDATTLARSASPGLGDFATTVTFAENDVNASLQALDTAVGLTDPDSGNFSGGRLDLYYVQGASAEDQLGVIHEGNGPGQIGVAGTTISYGGSAIGTVSGGVSGGNLRIDFTSSAATVEAVEALIQHLGYRNADSSPNTTRSLALRVSDGDGGTSDPSTLTLNITQNLDGTPTAHGEEQVNTFTYDYQWAPAVASLGDGSYVTAWISRSQDGNGGLDGVFAQRFASNGEAIGPEFRVNTSTDGNQREVKLTGLADGSFVIAWTDQNSNADGSSYGVYARHFDASGTATGAQFLVNSASTSSTQEQPAIAAFTGGGYIVTWQSSASLANGGDGSGYGVYAQRFATDGTPVGATFRVNTATSNSQYESDVATHADGSFVVSWRSDGQDGSGAGVYFQRFDGSANKLGSETLATTLTASNQYEAKVASLGDGGFVIVWRDDSGTDGSGSAVFGQRFDAAGAKLGSQFLVNETTNGSQYQPDVVGLANGGFVVTFYNDNYDVGGSGTTADVYIREYDAGGSPVDGQRKVNSFPSSSQWEPAIAHLGSDNFVVAWRSDTQDGSNSGIYQQLFGSAAELARPSASPVLDDFRAQRILVSDAASPFYAGLQQLIDADVDVQDADSANFDGGSFIVSLLGGATATEALGIRNQGSGTFQIGVSGSDISFGGTVIGSFTGGSAGDSLLTITLNANATPLAVRALAQNITYQNTAPPSGTTDRYVGFRLTDGDGGTSNAVNVEIQIQAALTPTVVTVDDIESSVTLTEAQAQAGGVVLDGAAQVNYNGVGSFNNGTLTISYLNSTGRVDDQLGIRNQGSGANQVGVSGTAVSFEGTQIGTLSGAQNGVNGNNLQITWNANATDQSIERVIENLTYSNASDGPNASRSIRFVLTDSNSTASAARDMQINVTPQVDGASPLFGEQQVNTYEPNEQHVPATAGLQGPNNGGYVVVWRSTSQDGNSYGIYGQRYDAQDAAVGAEFQANSETLGAQYEPEVASLANGGFVVVWRSESQDGSAAGVYGQIYGADGAPLGGEQRFNASTASNQYEPAVVGLGDGSFVVAYRSDYTNASGSYLYDVLARRFDAAGNELNPEFTLNTTTAGTQYNPRLAALAGGQFVAVYGDASGNDGSSYGVFSRVFNADGTQAVAEQVVSTTVSGQQSGHDVAALAGGGYVAVWWSADNQLYGQRFDAAGAKLPGGEFRISSVDTAPNNNLARVTALASGGFVVAWDANGYEVYVQQFDAAGNKVDGPTQVNTTTASTQYYPDIAAIGSGDNFVVTWASYNQEASTASSYGIFSQILGTPGSITRSDAPELVDVVNHVSFEENLVNAVPQRIDAAVRLTDADSANFDGGQLVVAIIPAGQQQADLPFTQDQLGILSTGSGAGQIDIAGNIVSYQGTAIGTIVSSGANGSNLVVNLNAAATPAAVEVLIEHLTYANTASDPATARLVSIQVSDGQGGASVPHTVEITVTPQVDGGSPLFGEQQVNTYEPSDQHVPATAGLQGPNNGGYVVVWRSTSQDGNSYGIYGQRYDAQGAAVGAEFQANSETLGAQYEPEVASLANGGFVVVWRSDNQDGSAAGVYGQIYGADGAPLGGELRFNASTASNQYEPAVVGLSDGSFVVAYRSDYTNASGSYLYDVLARRFDAAGNELNPEFTLNTTTAGTQYNPRLAALAGGQFVAVYGDASSNDGSSYGVFSRVFNADGTQAVAEQVVSTTVSGQQSGHDVAALAGGGYVAVWWSADNQLYGQRFDAAGAKLPEGEFRISSVDTAPNNNLAGVTALASGGFVVAWDANGYEVYVQQFDAAGNKVDGPTQVNTTTASTQYYPDIAAIGSGDNFVVTWASYNQEASTASSYGIFSQILGTPGSITRSDAPELVDVVNHVSFEEDLVNAAPQLIDAAVRLTDIDSASFNGGQLVVSVISGYGSIEQAQLPQAPEAQDQFAIRSQGTGAGQVSVSGTEVRYGGTLIGTIVADGTAGRDLVITFNGAASVPAVEAVIENLTYRNTASNPAESRLVSIQVSDGAGGASKPQVVQIDVAPQYDGGQPLFDEDLVNTYTPSDQSQPAMARLDDGGYVTVWTSETQDGWGHGIYGQRYDAQGVAVGNQFQVNDYTPYDQTEPVVASLDGGGFVVVWRDHGGHDGSSNGVFGQRYDADGLQVGEAFLINSSTTSSQYQPAIASVAGGGFIVAWFSDANQDGRYYDVYFQRFDNNGSPLGTETRANTSTDFENSTQYEPAITVLNDASFVVTWRADGGQDGSEAGIYAQRFAANGTPLGSEFRINTYTDSTQQEPSIAALSGGGFVVTWTSYYQDGGSSTGVFAQRYANDGTPLGSEFRVTTQTGSDEQQPAVSALANGGFVIAWTNGSQIFAQQFDANGVAVDGETRVDARDDNYAIQPAVLGLGDGNFVVSWTDRGDEASNSYGVYQRLFGNPADFSRQANPLLVDVASSVTFGENALNLAPQLIDPGVGLYDPDSANFAGGRLEVDYISGYGGQDQLGMQGLENQDQLGIRSEGDGPTQVRVSGLGVYYSGVQVGTITANGANHGKLAVEFNGNATVEAVESVIENLTYQNTSSNPFASRTVSVRLTDGDGGASNAHFITLNVTPAVDGAVPRGLEKTVNTTAAGDQVTPSVAHLTDGGYVVVWTDRGGADGSSYGVYGQRYDADDNAVGSQFRVNSTTSGAQHEARVVGLTTGGFVAVWRSESQDGSSAGVYAQRFDASGAPVGSEFRVNESTAGGQYQPDVTALAGGAFAVTWYNDNYDASGSGSYGDVYVRQFGADGSPLTGQIKANTPTASQSYQYEPAVAVLGDGSFVVTWRSDGAQDGSGSGVYAQHFAADGGKLGNEFRVNTYTDSNQHQPDIAALKDGGFLIVWRSEGQDLSSGGVYAQRFDATGNTIGTEFRVNTSTYNTQEEPAVTALENGGWVVTWTDQYGAAPNTYDVFLQQYDAAGRQLDGQTLVNRYTPYVQYQPAITSMTDGGFVVAYSSYVYSSDQNGDGVPDGGNNTQEIRLQRYSNTAPVLTDVFVSGQEDSSVTLTDALFISGFNDPEGQNLAAIKVTTLPAEGILKLDGVDLIAGQEISLAELQAGKLTYQGNPNYFGLDQFAWTGSDGVAFAGTPVYTNINLTNVNDAPALEAGADDTAAEGNLFSHAIALGDPDPDTHQVTVNWGDGSPDSVYNTSADLLNIGHTYADDGVYNVTVTANDQQGQANSVQVDGFTVTVSNIAPDVNLFGDATVVQNELYTLTLGGVIEPGADTLAEYRIDWGDGGPVQVVLPADLPANRQLTHAYATTGARTINVSLVDEDGSFDNVATKAITVAPPAEVLTVDAGADRTVNEGSTFVQTITFTDPTDTDPAGRLYTIDWGDGTTSSGRTHNAGTLDISHSYTDDRAGAYTVSVTLDDDGAQQGSDSFQVTVGNVAPTLTLAGSGSAAEGSLYALHIAASDPGDDTLTAYSVDWGDGTPATLLSAAELAAASGNVSHTYADGDAARTITVQATDEDGTWSHTKAVAVANVAPTVTLSGADAVAEGGSYTLTLAGVTDPGQDTPTSYTINWGDGNAEVVASLGSYSHLYADGNATPTISVLVTDEDGAHANAGTKVIAVTNVAPTLTLSGNASTPEGSAYVLNIAHSDPGADTIHTYRINWGDGSTVTVLSAAQLAAQGGNVNHVFADGGGAPTISVQATDEDGTWSNTKAVTVTNVAPTIAATGAADATVGVTYTLSLANYFDPGQDNLLPDGITVEWGDGERSNASGVGDLTHTYAAAGSPTITVSLADEDGSYANVASLTIDVAPPAPTVVIADQADGSVDEGDTFTRTILFADGEDSGDDGWSYDVIWNDGVVQSGTTVTQSFELSRNTADGDATLDATIIVSDTSGTDSDITSLTLDVSNIAPTAAVFGPTSIAEGSPYTLGVGPVTDPGADTRSDYSIDWGDGSTDSFTAAEWTAAAGSFTHTYADGPGDAIITVSATDEDGSFILGTQAVTIDNVAPSAILIGAATVAEGSPYTLDVGPVTDPGADTPSEYTINWGDGNTDSFTAAEWAAAAGSFTHTYADGPGDAIITVSATDEDGSFILGTQAVTIDNVAPSAILIGAATVAEGSPYTLGVGPVTDPGADTPSDYSIDWGDGNTDSFTAAEWTAAAGSFTHTYADGPGDAIITVSATDEDGSFILGTQAVTIDNVAPTIAATGAADATVDKVYTLSLANYLDPGQDSLLPDGITIDWGDGESSTASDVGDLTHTYAAAGNPTITISLADEDGSYVDVTILAINVVPADDDNTDPIADDETYTLRPGQTLDIPAPGVLDGDTDADGDPLTVLSVDTTGLRGSLTQFTDGSLRFTPEDGFSGTTSYTYTVSDGLGGRDTATVTLKVENSAPVADDETYTLRPGQTLDIPVPGVLDGDTDADGDTLTVLSVDTTGLRGSLTQFTDGSLRFTPEDGFSGTTSYTYTVSDGLGGRDTATVTLKVENSAPVADDETYTLRPGQTLDIPVPGVLDGDTDADGDPLTVLSVDTTGLRGSLTQFTDGSLRFTPEDGFSGTTSYTYTVSDGLGGRDSATVTLKVENSAPVARDDNYSVHAGTPLIVIPGVLGNDADADLDALFVSSWDASGLDGNLEVQADGSFTFTPTAGFTGSTAFLYTVSDGYGGSDTATVIIDVTNTAPVADDEVLHVWRNGSLSLSAPGVLTGDTDADGDTLQVSSVDTSGLAGTLVWQPDGSLLFTPTPDFAGSTGFSYQVADGNGGLDSGNVRIEVLPEPTTTVTIGNAPLRESGLGGQWTAAWTHTDITALHKHDVTDGAEAWSAALYHSIGSTLLSGGDVYAGDLGVSGQSAATSSVRQEIDGKEALRFQLAKEATSVTVNLSRFFINDNGSLFAESGRLRLLDDSGAVVAETTFSARNAAGTHQVSLSAQQGFSTVELSAGAWNGTDFVFGAYDGGVPISADGTGKLHGSDFVVDSVEFEFPVLGVPLPPDEV